MKELTLEFRTPHYQACSSAKDGNLCRKRQTSKEIAGPQWPGGGYGYIKPQNRLPRLWMTLAKVDAACL
jgi:hypothetical protein